MSDFINWRGMYIVTICRMPVSEVHFSGVVETVSTFAILQGCWTVEYKSIMSPRLADLIRHSPQEQLYIFKLVRFAFVPFVQKQNDRTTQWKQTFCKKPSKVEDCVCHYGPCLTYTLLKYPHLRLKLLLNSLIAVQHYKHCVVYKVCVYMPSWLTKPTWLANMVLWLVWHHRLLVWWHYCGFM